jgi:UDP-glucose 4-epimerase
MRTGLSTPGATHVLKVAVEAALGKRPYFEIFGTDYPTPDGTCIRDFIHVSDLADAHVSALRYLQGGGHSVTLNCGYGRGYSVRQVVDAVRRISGHDFPVRLSPRRQGDIVISTADNTRIRELLSWEPRFDDLDMIVSHALAWEQRLGNPAGSPSSPAPALQPSQLPDSAPSGEPLVDAAEPLATTHRPVRALNRIA